MKFVTKRSLAALLAKASFPGAPEGSLRPLKSIQVGETFRTSVDGPWYVAATPALLCGKGYVRVTTTATAREQGQPTHVVNLHGSTPVEVRS